MSLPPDSILCFVNCSCVKGCSTPRCSCKKASLGCSDLCRCKECQNNSLEKKEEELKELEDTNDCANSKDSDEFDSDDDESNSDFDVSRLAMKNPESFQNEKLRSFIPKVVLNLTRHNWFLVLV